MIFYGAIGVVLGGRVGSVLFYNFDSFLDNPLYLFKIWQGGMSFHGGFLGVLVAMEFYRRKLGCRFFEITDFIAPLVAAGALAPLAGWVILSMLNFGGRRAIYPGRVKLSCEQFPAASYTDFAGPLCYSPRHPTQLYEMVLERHCIVYCTLADFSKTTPGDDGFWLLFCCYTASPAAASEFIRLPDAHIGYLMNTDWLTRGIVLSVPMIIVGFAFILYARRAGNNATVS